ncbi:MAG TPA: hypothetical protein VK575_03770, partial [Gemmatimonadaceae bacterium]|nr:hypothetical protein [Gemmatimonadaceae bacterium]
MRGKGMMLAATLGFGTLPQALDAQVGEQKFQSELRLDAIFARSSAIEAAYGFTVPAGTYMRSGLVAGIGVGRHGV